MDEQKKVVRKNRKSALTREINNVRQFMAEDNVTEVKTRLENVKSKFREFEKAHEEFHDPLTEEKDIDDSDDYFNQVHENYIKTLVNVKDWLLSNEDKKAPEIIQPKQDVKNDVDGKQLYNLINLPKIELEEFDGNPAKFHSFFAVFDEHVHQAPIDPSLKLTRLIQYTCDRAQNSIRPCVIVGGQRGYDQAREILKRRYGSDHMVSEHLIQNIRSGKPVKTAEELQQFCDDLVNCQATLTQMARMFEVDSQHCIVEVVNRLQPYLRNRWKRLALEHKREKDRYPDFASLVKFVQEQADEATDPVYGRSGAGAEVPVKTKRGTSSFSTNISHTAVAPVKYPCKLCGGIGHKLFHCEAFKSLKPHERYKFVKDNKLCENCLMSNHQVATCRKQSTCSVPGCGQKHTKFIHLNPGHGNGDDRRANQVSMNVEVNHTMNDVKSVNLPVVRVKVNGSVNATVLLDTASTGSFCTKRLADTLGLKGHEASYVLSTMNSVKETRELSVVDLQLTSVNGEKESLHLRNVLVVDEIPAKVPMFRDDVLSYPHLSDLSFDGFGRQVDLLIGQDHSEALVPLQIRKGKCGEPFAVKTLFGWSLNGVLPVSSFVSRSVVSNFISCNIEDQVRKLWDIENEGLCRDEFACSQDDVKVVDLWDRNIQVENGHYVLPIPWKDDVLVPNNLSVAMSRLKSLRVNLGKRGLFSQYDDEISKLLTKGYAEKIPASDVDLNDRVWYLPHHGVVSDKKPGKLRVVFDCASRFMGESLNDKCLQGPNYTNKLFDVLLRFRRHEFVIMGDVEAMYYQVLVPKSDRNYLRFLWFDSDDEIVKYRMKCHIFGGVWCASSSSYALRRAVLDHADDDPVVTDVVHNAFYVDDCLLSCPSPEEAVSSVEKVCSVLAKGGFRLTKFVTNDEDILRQIPEAERAAEVKDFRYGVESRALGIKWNPRTDVMYFDVQLETGNVTRRKVLSIMSSTFDPLGLISPVLVAAKILFQDITRLKFKWDEVLPLEIQNRWLEWVNSLHSLKDVMISRCVKPVDYNDAYLELHHFSDASERAYGCCSYLRCVNKEGKIQVNLLCSKSKVAPIKSVSIPRLELQAAVVAVRMDATLKKQLHLDLGESRFWSDSQIALQYIANEKQRFHVFVANRVSEIRNQSHPSQWGHISGTDNPADLTTREQNPEKLLASNWFHGPDFLHEYKSEWTVGEPIISELTSEDPEVKAFVVTAEEHPLDRLIAHYSGWYRLKRAVVWWQRFKTWLKMKKTTDVSAPLAVSEIKEAELQLIIHVQGRNFKEEIERLKTGRNVSKSSFIKDLSPELDSQGLLRVGGRIKHAEIDYAARHPCILPGKDPISEKIVRELHERAHLGTEWTLSLLRRNFWITNARRLIKNVKRNCVTCKKLYAATCVQKMADLPVERLSADNPPFSYVGVDCFGPFLVKVGRSEVKRYGCLFTCLSMRAVHIEKLDDLSTDCFLNGFRRFVARRGMPLKVISDNGTNFVGGVSELSKAFSQLDLKEVEAYGTKSGIQWSFNPPHASHMGGVWEGLIRVIRRVFSAVLCNCRLNDDILSTVFAEVENIVNSRPITKTSDSVEDAAALSPNHLLLLRDGSALPQGNFKGESMYSRRWRYVQNLADQFWRRWIREYIPELVKRQKWLKVNVNVKVNDVVLIKDENTPRHLWPLGLVTKVIEGRDGLVRTVHLKTKSTVLVRPITKIVMLEESVFNV